MIKEFVKNRKGQKIAILVERPENPKGLAFVMHGLGGFKEQAHIETIRKTFLDNGYTTVRFDSTHSLGESDGLYEDATATKYFEDLEDVVNWSKNQDWFRSPFALAGHSLGGLVAGHYAQCYPTVVKALAPIATVVSGKLSREYHSFKDKQNEWKRTGFLITESKSKPGVVKRLKWSYVEDRDKYDLTAAEKLKMPILMVVGDADESDPYEHQKVLYDALPSEEKELFVIKGAPHTFRSLEHLKQLSDIFDKWLKSL